MPGGRIHFLSPARRARAYAVDGPLLLTGALNLPEEKPRQRILRPPREEGGAFCQYLLDEGVVNASGFVHLLALQALRPGDLCGTVRAQGLVAEPALTAARARYHGLRLVDPIAERPDVRLIDTYGAADCLRDGVLPWRRIGDLVVVLCDRPNGLLRHRERLLEVFDEVTLALAPRAAMEAALQDARSRGFVETAETRCPADESCRNHAPVSVRVIGKALAVLGLAALVLPGGIAGLLTLAAVLALVASVGLKAAALFAAVGRALPEAVPQTVIARLPVVSVMVALYREADIAPRLVRRLGRIDYPRDLLDAILVVEADDTKTRSALAVADLPPWMRVVVVPAGAVKTKPRALNYALEFCRGSIVGVYDAEDAPEAGQIWAVVERFHQRDAKVACLQGMLDFYNPATNWMARCFTMEYAAWFRIVLPGLDRLGLPIPLGGTTLFFRKAALRALGGWDAHNVTEDADLGVRLYRHGYRTEIIDTVTGEEANCLALPWVRQRSRWIKGYMMTWLVHMRDPAALRRQLGTRGFVAFQVLFLGSLIHALMAPLLLSFWLVTFGVPHPVADALPGAVVWAMVGLFILCEGVNLTLGVMALKKSGHRINPLWLITLNFYHPLAALAAYKALWEVITNPYYWDKTSHGKFDAASGV